MTQADPAPRGDKRERIIDAAIAVFADRGFHKARVTDIAHRAGVADGTIYLYFRNKEDLLLTIFEEKMDLIIASLKATLAPIDDPLERIHAFALHHYSLVRRERALAEVLQVELRLSNRFLKEYRPEKLWKYLGLFAQVVRDGQERGVIRADMDPFIVMWAFFGAIDELGMQWILARKKARFKLDQAAHQVADIFIQGIQARP
ncbi:MAG: TetR/AcrR family transcriptional regulator [Deltaproteobacteria bacterium]|nr:TetR/AcrR family transcriptional regulator [Deltaproteobacteria bacterium]